MCSRVSKHLIVQLPRDNDVIVDYGERVGHRRLIMFCFCDVYVLRRCSFYFVDCFSVVSKQRTERLMHSTQTTLSNTEMISRISGAARRSLVSFPSAR